MDEAKGSAPSGEGHQLRRVNTMALREKRGVWPIHKACNRLWGLIAQAWERMRRI
jgi:hypothetical protein